MRNIRVKISVFLFLLLSCSPNDAVFAAQYSTAGLDGLWTIAWNGSATELSNVIFDSGGNIVWSDDSDILSGRITVRSSGLTDGRIVLASGTLSLTSQMSSDTAMSGSYTQNPGRIAGAWTAARVSSVLLAGDGFDDQTIAPAVWAQFETNDAANQPVESGGRLRIVKNGDGKRTGIASQFTISSQENFLAQVDVLASECTKPCGIGIDLRNVKEGDFFDEHIFLSFEKREVVSTVASFVAQRFIGDVQVERTGATTLKNQGVLVLRNEGGELSLSYTEKNGIPTALVAYTIDDWTLESDSYIYQMSLYGWAEGQATSGAGFNLDNFRLYLLP